MELPSFLSEKWKPDLLKIAEKLWVQGKSFFFSWSSGFNFAIYQKRYHYYNWTSLNFL